MAAALTLQKLCLLISVAEPIPSENWIPVTKHHKSGVYQGEAGRRERERGSGLGRGRGEGRKKGRREF